MSTSNRQLDLQLQTFSDASMDDSSVYFSTPFHHLHRQNAGRTFQWFGTDQPERFNREGGYTQTDISYQFNAHGYRCEELTTSPVVFIGCSFTFGVGLKVEETWAHQVARHLQIPYINLAYQGAGIQYIQRTLMKVCDLVQPKLVVALIPYNYRFEFISSEQGNPLRVWSKSGITSQSFFGANRDRTYAYELFTTREQEDFNLLHGFFAVQKYLSTRGCQFAWNVWEYEERRTPYFNKLVASSDLGIYWPSEIFNGLIRWKDLKNKARDSSHPGREYHAQYAQFILEKIQALKIS